MYDCMILSATAMLRALKLVIQMPFIVKDYNICTIYSKVFQLSAILFLPDPRGAGLEEAFQFSPFITA